MKIVIGVALAMSEEQQKDVLIVPSVEKDPRDYNGIQGFEAIVLRPA